ncbi:hypothetical protein DL768_009751 [Monosporascus sp. mg162]|nr:hypothetical protein DL768_009751 [Monosporascus sp. mg162]
MAFRDRYGGSGTEEKTADVHDAAKWLDDRVRLSRERAFMRDLTGNLYDEGAKLFDKLRRLIAMPEPQSLHFTYSFQ